MPRFSPMLLLAAFAALAAPVGSIATPPTEPTALTREVNLATAAATAVIGGLQQKINGGTATPADIAPEALSAGFAHQYQLLAGQAQAPAGADRAAIRATIERSMREVVTEFRQDILRGGQDAFVPAFFRAQLLQRFNTADRRFRTVATTRDSELINRDSSLSRLIDDPEILTFVTRLMEAGHKQPEMRSFAGRTVGYWPMVIAEGCASCHQRNGLNQQVGGFGGATVVILNQ